jgi:hypothetical protein
MMQLAQSVQARHLLSVAHMALVVDHRDFDRFTADRIKQHAPLL